MTENKFHVVRDLAEKCTLLSKDKLHVYFNLSDYGVSYDDATEFFRVLQLLPIADNLTSQLDIATRVALMYIIQNMIKAKKHFYIKFANDIGCKDMVDFIKTYFSWFYE